MIQPAKVERFVPFGREYCSHHPFCSESFPNSEDGGEENTKQAQTLYIKKKTVIWSKGSSPEARVVVKAYTAKSQVNSAVWCSFSSSPQAQESQENAKVMHSLCVVQDDSIDVLTSDGSLFITPLPFPVSRVWTISGGLLLERSLNVSTQHREVPIIFSVMHPLDEPRPVTSHFQGKPSHFCDPTVSVVLSSDDPPIVMTYDSEIGLHSLWMTRKANSEDYPAPLDQTAAPADMHSTSSFLPTPVLTSAAHSRLSTATPPRHFTPLRLHTPMSASRPRHVQSPAAFRLMSPALRQLSPFPDSPLGSFYRSPPTSSRTESSFWEGGEPLLPEVCLVHVWQEAPLAVRHGIRGRATKAFTTTDFCGVHFLCFLIGNLDRLRGVRFVVGEFGFVEVKEGPSLEIPAKDAAPLQCLDMMLVLDLNHTAVLYSGFSKVCQVALPCLMLSEELQSFSSAWPGQMSEEEGKCEGPSIRPLKKSLVSLRDPTGYGCNTVLTDGSVLNINFARLAASEAVSACVEALKCAVPRDTALQALITYYTGQRHTGQAAGPGEEARFAACIAGLMGLPADIAHRGNDEAQPESPLVPAAKKSKTQDSSAEAGGSSEESLTGGVALQDWAWLMGSAFHKRMQRHAVGLTPMPPAESTENAGGDSEIRLKEDALLFPWIPSLLFAWHLVYEELKLSVHTSPSLYPLAKFLSLLARTLDWSAYVDHFCRDHPALVSEGILDKAAAHQDQLKKMKVPDLVSEEPPSVHRWIGARLTGRPNKAFPLLRRVCKRTQLILKTYSFLIPLDADPSGPFHDVFESDVPSQWNADPSLDKLQGCQTNADKAVLFMAENGFTSKDVDSLPFGISIPLREAVHECLANPPLNLPALAYDLIGREDLGAQVRSSSELSHVRHAPLNQTKLVDGEVDDGMTFDQEVVRLRFGKDLRVQEVRRLLQSARPVCVSLVQKPEVSDHDFIQEQEARLLLICRRTMALSVGRGMFTLGTSRPVLTETLPVPHLELNGRAPPRNTVVSLEHIDTPADMRVWPEFHNGVAAGLRIAPGISEIDSTWIAYNKPKDNQPTNEHAGFLMALGLNGHISSLAFMNLHDYLCMGHELTSVGILLGMAIAKRGTMELAATRVLSIHLDALLPPMSAELDLPHAVQVAALLGVGLLYQATAHRRMAEVLLSEIGRPPGPEMENAVNRESYSLAAGLALGLVMLEQGNEPGSVADLKIADTLYHYMVGGHKKPQTGAQREKFKSPSYQIKEGDSVNIDVTAAGATLALGLMFMKTNNRSVASWLSAPDTQFLLDFVRPDLLLLRLLSRGLIMWDSVLPSVAWVESHIPAIVQKFAFIQSGESAKVDGGDLDLQTLSQAQANIVAGCCLVMGLKFAGSANQEAFKCLMHYTKWFRELLASGTAEQAGKPTVETCLDVALLALSLVMAGTGNLDVLRIARQLHKRHSPDVHFGNHMAVHMAIGLLFLGGGRYTLCTSGPAVAALVCALYPKFPISSTDNRYHLQAFRHLYVLAAEPRVLVPREVDTGLACYAPLEVTLKACQFYPESTFQLMAPCIIPELHLIKKISVVGPRYLSITVELGEDAKNASWLTSKLGTVYVKRRAGFLAYTDDPKGYRNLLARTFAAQTDKTEVIRSFSSDPQIIALAELFCDNSSDLPPKEREITSFVSSVLLECVTAEKLEILKTYLQVYQAVTDLDRRQNPLVVQEIKLVLTYYRKAFPRLSEKCSRKPLLSDDFIAECKVRAEERVERLIEKAPVPISGVVDPTEYRKRFCPALACFLVYHGFPLQPRFSSFGNVDLEEFVRQNEDLPFAMATMLLR